MKKVVAVILAFVLSIYCSVPACAAPDSFVYVSGAYNEIPSLVVLCCRINKEGTISIRGCSDYSPDAVYNNTSTTKWLPTFVYGDILIIPEEVDGISVTALEGLSGSKSFGSVYVPADCKISRYLLRNYDYDFIVEGVD